MKKIKLFSIIAAFMTALTFTSCNSDSDSGFEWPTPTETAALFSEIQGYHSAGLLLPGSIDANSNVTNADKFEKDSLQTSCAFTTGDSILTIHNVDVAKYAKYINDESISAEVAKLAPQDMKIKLIPYNAVQKLFITATYDITYTNEAGKKVKIQFYSGISNYSVAQIGTKKTNNKKVLLVYLTPGRIMVDEKANDVIKTYYYQGYTLPYVTYLEVEL